MLAVVTGHSRGIGQALTQHLSRKGYAVLGLSRSNGFDLSTPEGLEKSVRHVRQQTNEVHVLINNAGQLWLDETTRSPYDLQAYITLLTLSPYYLTLHLPLAEGAVVVNVASAAAHHADRDVPLYAALKAAVVSLTKSLAVRLAPKVRVVSLSPGFTKGTDLVTGEEALPEEAIQKLVPLRKEVDLQALQLTLDYVLDCPYLTGADLVVDGGFSVNHAINFLEHVEF